METEYDNLGRVERTTNPYRQGETKLWSTPRYDELGRAVESYAPALEGQTGASFGVTAYDISTAPGYIGTVVTTTDASGRKGRAFTNALGQLIRVDEPDYQGGLTVVPQSSPTPTPTPTPGGGPIGGCLESEQPCAENLTGNDYPMHSTYYKYNAPGKLVEVIQGEQHRYFKYDSLGRLIRVKQPEQEVNAALNLADSFNPSGQWTAGFTYDVLGNVLTATDAKGVTITNIYDKASRVKTRSYSDGTPTVSYFYDGKGLDSQQSPNYAKGKLTKVTSSVSETRYTLFDNLGRLTQSEQRTPFATETVGQAAPRVSTYNYNLSGALIEQTYPSGRVVKNEFEPDGNLSRIYGKVNTNATERTYANGFSYTPDGRIERLKLGNGLWESAKFNTRLQVTELALGHSNGDGSLWKLGYEYGEFDANGNIDPVKNTGNIARQTTSFNGLAQPFVQSFRYDSLYRLIEARETSGTTTTAPQTWRQQFVYDRFGNRTQFQKFVGTTQITLDSISFPSVNAATNRLNSGQGYGYDKNGNVIVDAEGRQFTFNGDNKQTEVKNVSNVLVGRYFYDGEGKRVKKKTYDPNGVEQEETVFVYDGMGKLVAEYSTTPPPPTPTTSFTATDQLGSPRVITNSLGEVISRRDFMPFGEELAPDATYRKTADKYGAVDSVRQRFTGYQKDIETGLDFAEARMYENRHARFTAVDPLLASGKSANPQTFNRYVYVMNNPLAYTDPTGLQVASHAGKVYTDGTHYGRKPFEGSYQFEGSRYVDAADGFTYSVATNGFYSIGNTAEINARAQSLAMADSRRREQLMSESLLPSTWIPELSIDPPGYAEASQRRLGGRDTINSEGETDIDAYNYKIDEGRAMGLMLTTQFTNFGGFRSPPRIPSGGASNTFSNSISTNSFSERAFLSENFGVNSRLFGNSAFNSSQTSGLLNQPGSLFKAGWSGTGAPKTFFGNNKPLANPLFGNNGGMQFRMTFGVNPTNLNQGATHFYVPNTFVPNRFSNPFVFRPPPRGGN